MKKILIHTVPVLFSFLWLMANHHSLNPISLKGPYFLSFYLVLIFGFYTSIFSLKYFKEQFSKTSIYFMMLIFILGIIKWTKGFILEKPIGYLSVILIFEAIVAVVFIFKNSEKK
ncbi:hypothetical protein VUJ46_14835 [Chryseobacterium sp. MYb264]|uniref:hypothetical protein n=1 Tax=Chryseobacterium sp. MYb264 TaxID=2745153 RepID=UPI002E12BA40|nr:hypothetical protein VUJ46_14835 [Chryseobacterium sp. MYb264]